jgi:hypothetical protein
MFPRRIFGNMPLFSVVSGAFLVSVRDFLARVQPHTISYTRLNGVGSAKA